MTSSFVHVFKEGKANKKNSELYARCKKKNVFRKFEPTRLFFAISISSEMQSQQTHSYSGTVCFSESFAFEFDGNFKSFSWFC